MAYSSSASLLARAQGNRFAQITTNDHSATLWVVTLLSMIYAILVLAVRLGFTRWRAHAFDDIIITIAHLVAFGMWALLFSALKSGLGKSYSILDDAQILTVQQLFFTSRILLFVALAFSKCSILLLIRSVFAQNTKVSILAIGNGVLAVIWGLIGILAITIGCSVGAIIPKPGNEYCLDSIPWLKAVAAGDITTEIVIMILPIIGFHSSLMSIKSKLIVVIAFFTRIPNVVFALMHFLAYSKFMENHQLAISIVPTVAWQSVLLSYNLISATTPLLKGFTQGFKTTGVSFEYLREGGTTSGGSGYSGSYELKSIMKSRSRPKVSKLNLTPSNARATTSVQGNAKKASKVAPKNNTRSRQTESASIASQDSRRIMIKQEWKISED